MYITALILFLKNKIYKKLECHIIKNERLQKYRMI